MKHVEQIKQMCDDIYEITGIKAVFYDADMRCVYFHPGSMGPFCSCIRQDAELTEACLRCDREGFAQCRKTGELVIYQCHMGLTEAVAPVLDNEVLKSGHQMTDLSLNELDAIWNEVKHKK